MNQSNLLTVRVAGVMNRQAVVLHAGRTLPCLLSGRLLRQKDSLAVGDRAEAEVLGGGQYRLTRVLPRTSALRRPSRRGSGDALLAANADFVPWRLRPSRSAGPGAPWPLPHHCRLSLPGAGRHPLAGHPRFPGRVPRRQARPGLPPPALRGSPSPARPAARWSPQRGPPAGTATTAPTVCPASTWTRSPATGPVPAGGLWSRWACGCARGASGRSSTAAAPAGPSAPTGSRRMTTRPSSSPSPCAPWPSPPFPCPPCPGGSFPGNAA